MDDPRADRGVVRAQRLDHLAPYRQYLRRRGTGRRDFFAENANNYRATLRRLHPRRRHLGRLPRFLGSGDGVSPLVDGHPRAVREAGLRRRRPRLKEPDNAGRIAELRAIIRDIRSDEANVYRELRLICSMCQDYEGSSRAARAFYPTTQAKLVYAVTSHTPSEIVRGRVDAASDTMGLTTWPNDNIRKADVSVSKNYLSEGEVQELNRLTNILLDVFEDQLQQGRLVVMDDAMRLLDEQLKGLGRAILTGGGSVSSADARLFAEGEYAGFAERRKLARHREADAGIAALTAEARGLPKGRGKRAKK